MNKDTINKIDEVKDLGKIKLSEADDANIPINCFLIKPSKRSNKWRWIAYNFMPGNGISRGASYRIESDSKEALMKEIKKYVVPLYEIALNNLKTTGANYFWQPESEQNKS